MKRVLRSFFLIINYKTLIITTLAVISSEVCFRFGLIAKFPDMLVGVAIVFPVVFSIGSAYNRRETALQRFSDFKAHPIAMYYASRDWTTDSNHDLPQQVRKVVMEMMSIMRRMFCGRSAMISAFEGPCEARCADCGSSGLRIGTS